MQIEASVFFTLSSDPREPLAFTSLHFLLNAPLECQEPLNGKKATIIKVARWDSVTPTKLDSQIMTIF